MEYQEPSDLDWAIASRVMLGLVAFGPLTRDEAASEAAYEEYQAASEAEYEAQLAAGGRQVCPECGERRLVESSVCTLGYPGHPGAEFSAYYKCEACNHEDM